MRVARVLTVLRAAQDEDFHVVIADANQNTMIIEIPAPSCVPTDSPFYKGVVDSRSTFTAAYQPTPKFQNCNVPVSVIGCVSSCCRSSRRA